MSWKAALARTEHHLKEDMRGAESSSSREQKHKARLSTPFVTNFNWGSTAAGNPNRKHKRPQKQVHETRAALEFNGMQAAEMTTPMSAGSKGTRAPSRSRARTKKEVDGMTSDCAHDDAKAETSVARQKIAVQIWPKKIDGVTCDREKERTSAMAHKTCADAATRCDDGAR